MLTRTVAIIVALGSIAIATPIAQGALNKHHLKLTIKDATITSQGDRPGNKQTTAGLIAGKPFGNGVESITDKVTAVTSTTITFAGTITIYTTHGIINGTITIKIKPASSGGATGTGTGNITGGTGRYTESTRRLHLHRRRVRDYPTVRVSRHRQRLLLTANERIRQNKHTDIEGPRLRGKNASRTSHETPNFECGSPLVARPAPPMRGQRGRPALRAIDAHSTVRGAPTAGTERAQRPPCRPLRKAASRSRCFVAPAEQFSRDRHSLPSATDRALPLHALPSKGVADIRSHGRNSTFKNRRRGLLV